MFVRLNPQLLSVPNVFIVSMDVLSFLPCQLKHRPGHWPRVLTTASAGNQAPVIYIRDLVSNVHNEPPFSAGILNHDIVVPPEIAIGAVRPRHLSVGLLVLANGLSVGVQVGGFLGVIVGFLDFAELEVLVPISDFGLVGVLGASLQLLGCVLHFIYIILFNLFKLYF